MALRRICLVVPLVAGLLGSVATPGLAQDYDPGAPCGRDETGSPIPCTRPDASATIEADCQATGRIESCLPYHQRACEINGIALACQVYALGVHCNGGDPARCQAYLSILQANAACGWGDQAACGWLRQQGF